MTKIAVRNQHDAARAAMAARRFAAGLGFNTHNQTLIATAISELAVNITRYADHGHVELDTFERAGRRGFEGIVRDKGPGIADIPAAMRDGHTQGDSLGMGLPGVKRMMDEFLLTSEPGKGTTATVRMFLR